MEKYTPTYNLEEFKQSNFLVTATANKTAFDLGFDSEGIRKVVSTMQKNQFYKSMTSYANHKIYTKCNFTIYVAFFQRKIILEVLQ